MVEVLTIFALALFIVAAAWPPYSLRLVAAGLACLTATLVPALL